jgi:asparagine N-glycosylation enzyme membrane subunit Stt3
VNWLKKPSTTGGVVFLSVVAGVLAGVAVVTTGAWRLGVTIMGASCAVAFLARSVLPDERAGMLRIRRRFVDLTTMGLCALAMLILAVVIPNRR